MKLYTLRSAFAALFLSAGGAAVIAEVPAPVVVTVDPLDVPGKDPSAALSGRLFVDQPMSSSGPLARVVTPGSVDVTSGALAKRPGLPRNVPFDYNPMGKTHHSDGYASTSLSISETYKANYTSTWGQLMYSSTPVYVDLSMLLLSPEDKKLLAEDQAEMRGIIDKMRALKDRAQQISKELTGLSNRGRPLKVIKDVIVQDSFDKASSVRDTSNPIEIPLSGLAPSVIAPHK